MQIMHGYECYGKNISTSKKMEFSIVHLLPNKIIFTIITRIGKQKEIIYLSKGDRYSLFYFTFYNLNICSNSTNNVQRHVVTSAFRLITSIFK
jgi:hypothetical protein